MLNKQTLITGTQVHYYFICHTKLWLFSHFIQMEHNSDLVKLGKLFHETSYSKERKEELIDNTIAIDFIKKGNVLELHEVKKSKKMEEAHKYQILYYLYYLKKKGINAIGIIDYPLLKKRITVKLNKEEETHLENILKEIREIINKEKPPPIKRKKICNKCSYYHFCFSGE